MLQTFDLDYLFGHTIRSAGFTPGIAATRCEDGERQIFGLGFSSSESDCLCSVSVESKIGRKLSYLSESLMIIN